jgi:hypothetical protein
LHHLPPEIQAAVAFLRHASDPSPQIIPLAGDASSRRFFRCVNADGRTSVAMIYPQAQWDEAATFLEVHRFLETLNMPVPQVYQHLPRYGMVMMEDLGDVLLETEAQTADPSRLETLYTNAVDILLYMTRAASRSNRGCVAFTLAFDYHKLMQEMRFFTDHFVKGLCQGELFPRESRLLERFFHQICDFLAGLPRFFTHRDYHARNLLIHDDKIFMIDFQDARMGPCQYDLASLLRDSYITLPDALVDALILRYAEARGEKRTTRDAFRYQFDIMSLQRNIKALGTFGYQMAYLGNERYRDAIPRTARYIGATILRHEELKPFRDVVREHICKPAFEQAAGYGGPP